jgi:uncharacterized membrane protein YeaQ/YmgE (transglycosylase-associated protein family)
MCAGPWRRELCHAGPPVATRRAGVHFCNQYIPGNRTGDMHFIATVFIGLIVGIVAKLLMPGRDPGGWIVTILLGLAGSFVAQFMGTYLGWYRQDEPAGFIASVIGAIVLLALYRMITPRGRLGRR